ncbi:transposase [Streptomyces sp. BE133]|uniref:transposase n=1 Tax=Streptomyces sp. BE133 TaxID=3002523 RepID=UPI003FA78D41
MGVRVDQARVAAGGRADTSPRRAALSPFLVSSSASTSRRWSSPLSPRNCAPATSRWSARRSTHGPILGAYLLAEIGDRPEERFGSGRSLAAYAGVAPVTWASGSVTRVALRRASSVHLRSTLHTAAFSLAMQSPTTDGGVLPTTRTPRPCGNSPAGWSCACTGACPPACRTTTRSPSATTLGSPAPPLCSGEARSTPTRSSTPGRSSRSPVPPSWEVAKALGVSTQTIYRHVLGRSRQA